MIRIRRSLSVALIVIFASTARGEAGQAERTEHPKRPANAESRGRGQARPRRAETRIPPTHKDVRYGPHERNVLDFWQAESETPTPLVVYIHGGGFRAGSKETLRPGILKNLLEAGISVAALNYRFIKQKRLPAAHHDCRRALQFLRGKAKPWHLDKKRVGAFGGSAGAQICMWLAFHDEMADPRSADPIARESTRLTCVATNGGQTSMDFAWWKKHIPGYDTPHRKLDEVFDAETDAQRAAIVKDISALSIISKDDPPIHMSYAMKPDAPIPSDSSRARGWKVHHVTFGLKLAEKMAALSLETDLKYPGRKAKYESIPHFFKAKLLKRGK